MSLWRLLALGQFNVLLGLYALLGVARHPQQIAGDYNDLAMHFAGYVIAGISASLALPHKALWQRFALLFAYSTGVEVIQYTLPWRSFDLWDIGANSLGVGVGLCLAMLGSFGYRVLQR